MPPKKKEILVSPSIVQTMHNLITSWLTILEEEHFITKKITLQSVFVDQAEQELAISFDRSPLNMEASTFQNLMWIQSLLKTIKASSLPVTKVRFLVDEQPLIDSSLDFSHPWPVEGYY